ncbi:MAG: LL-diaminopimelate aminotransferase [Candidatus Omnitrophica bacterium]|nr:LL-diaminopimelate aminotransferase [Candidatus Omnitrophota bacterium]
MADFNLDPSKRLESLPPYLFVEIDKAKRLAQEAGRDIIDLGIGDPDQPTPEFIIEALKKAAEDGTNHHYALDAGLFSLREQIAKWYLERFNVKLDPETEVYPLIGSKEGLAHLPLGLINPEDKVLVPEPAYPAYRSAAIFAGANVIAMPLLEKNGYLPDLDRIPKAKLAYVNYPNNPTAAVAEESFYKKLTLLAARCNMVVASDLAYSQIYYDDVPPMSFLQVEGAKEVGIEFHSLSKTYNMTGWRIGWVCGNKKIISYLARVKSNIDSGIFQAIQFAATVALKDRSDFCKKMRDLYQERRDIFVEGLNEIGWKTKKPLATFYVWAHVPTKEISVEFAKRLLEDADIVSTPGVGFGKYGEGYVRFALTVSKERLQEAVRRIKKVL